MVDHFHNLLGKIPGIEQVDVDLLTIQHDFQISDGEFTLEKMAKVK